MHKAKVSHLEVVSEQESKERHSAQVNGKACGHVSQRQRARRIPNRAYHLRGGNCGTNGCTDSEKPKKHQPQCPAQCSNPIQGLFSFPSTLPAAMRKAWSVCRVSGKREHVTLMPAVHAVGRPFRCMQGRVLAVVPEGCLHLTSDPNFCIPLPV